MATSSDIERELLRSDSEPSGTAGGSSGIGSLDRDSQQHMLQRFAKLLNAKLEQKFTTFKRSFEEKEEQHATEIKIKSEANASSSFKYKGNRIQYEFNTSIFDRVESCSTQLLVGNLSKVNNELEQIKVLINKRNKLIRFADKSFRPYNRSFLTYGQFGHWASSTKCPNLSYRNDNRTTSSTLPH